MLLLDFLEHHKENTDPALTMRMGYRIVSLTYKDVYDLSLRVACLLKKHGVEKGDKVVLLAPNSPYWVCVFWGTLIRGAILVPMNVQSTASQVEKVLLKTGAKLFFKHQYYREDITTDIPQYEIEYLNELLESCGCDLADKEKIRVGAKEDVVQEICGAWDAQRGILKGDDAGKEIRFEDVKNDVAENDITQILYSSGTTGDPKGVELTHKNQVVNTKALTDVIPIQSKDTFLSVLPLSHSFEQVAGFLSPFSKGAHIVYVHSRLALADLMREFRPTKIAAVPEVLQILMDRVERKIGKWPIRLGMKLHTQWLQRMLFWIVLRSFGGKLRIVASGGAPLDPELEKKWNALGVTLIQGYGLTETAPILTVNPLEDRRLGSVGKALPGVSLRIAADGEVQVQGENVFRGYFQDQEKTRAAFTSDNWFKTEDIGRLDDDGYLFLQGRKKYMVLRPDGQNVFPEDIELALNEHGGVRDSTILNIEEASGRVAFQAVLLLEEEADPKAIIEETNKKLASYQQIGSWKVWPGSDFPRSATRKVQKEKVRKFLEERMGEEHGAETVVTPLIQLLSDITGFQVQRIHENTNVVRELGIDSLLRVELISRIEKDFNVYVEESFITQKTDVRELQRLVDTAGPPPKKRRFKKWQLSLVSIIFRRVAQEIFIFPIIRIFLKVEKEGLENIKDIPYPVIYMPNHTSVIDSMALIMALPSIFRLNLSYAAAYDDFYKKYKVGGAFQLLMNIYPFPRREYEDIQSGLEFTGRMLDNMQSVVVFPEGKISEDGKLLEIKRGAGLIAVEMGVPVVPVNITGVLEIWPGGLHFPRKRGTAKVKFGKPFKLSKYSSHIKATKLIEENLKSM